MTFKALTFKSQFFKEQFLIAINVVKEEKILRFETLLTFLMIHKKIIKKVQLYFHLPLQFISQGSSKVNYSTIGTLLLNYADKNQTHTKTHTP